MSELIEYAVDGDVAVITLNNPKKRNAQSPKFLIELNDLWMNAARDPEIKVLVLQANGPHFSSGHDLSATGRGTRPAELGTETQRGIENFYEFEHDVYFGYTKAWRDIRKPTIAAVQGACVAAGLMLAWPCDLILASEDAYFSDPVLQIGVGGIEYHAHAYEFGARRAKEMLFTAGVMSAEEALRIGMINRVVPLEDLRPEAMKLAHKVAEMDSFALAQAKRAVNLAIDAQRHVALEANFDNHWTGHHHVVAIKHGEQSNTLTPLEDMIATNKKMAAQAATDDRPADDAESSN